jgi:hypothetical protein
MPLPTIQRITGISYFPIAVTVFGHLIAFLVTNNSLIFLITSLLPLIAFPDILIAFPDILIAVRAIHSLAYHFLF